MPMPLVLIVDDNLDNLKVLASLLKAEYRVMVATCGEDALQLAQRHPVPDLILLDIMMPHMDGYEVCRLLKNMPATRDIPVVLITASSNPDDETRGFQAGASDYLTKPVNPPLLWARTRAQIALAEKLKHARNALSTASGHIVRLGAERNHAEIQHQRLYDLQKILLAITSMAMRQDSHLDTCLCHTMDQLAAMEWLPEVQQGAIFLPTLQGTLAMVVYIDAGYQAGHPAYHNLLDDDPDANLRIWRHALGPETAEITQPTLIGTGLLFLPLLDDRRQRIGLVTFRIAAGESPLLEDALSFMADVADTFSNLVQRRCIEASLRINQFEVQRVRNEMIQRLGVAAEFRDTETGMHVMRMSQYAVTIAWKMGCEASLCEQIGIAAPMHDVGKIGIDDAILRKPGKLTDEEFAVMKTHTTIGGRILEGDDPLMQVARQVALTHHEKWNGTGYPAGLREQDIPLVGRICAVADVFDALTMERPYKQAWPAEKAIDLIRTEAGQHFDPQVVAAFLQVLPEIEAVRARYQDRTIDIAHALKIAPESTDDTATADTEVWIPWREEYSVGIDTVDVHHRYLLDWTNRLYRAITEHAGVEQVAKALFALEEYTRIHFAAEEAMMEAYGYRDLVRHRQMHRTFEQAMASFRAEMYHNPLVIGVGIVHHLRTWWLTHILKTDREILQNLDGHVPVQPGRTE